MPFSLIGGLFSGAGSLFGGLASSSAASQQSAAANKAIDLETMEYLDIASKLAPFLNTGTNALQVLAELFGVTYKDGQTPSSEFNRSISSVIGPPPSPNAPGANFQASPGYQYQLGQAQNAIQNSAANRTGAVSGNMMRGLQENATGLANQDYWKWYNALTQNYGSRYSDEANRRNQIISVLTGLAGGGQNAAVQQGGFGQNAASNIGSLGLYGANAQAAGTLGTANAFGNLFSNPSFTNSLSQMFSGPQYSGIAAEDTGAFQDLVGISPGYY